MTYRVGISLRVIESVTYPETRDAISHDWIRFLAGHGVVPVLIPNSLPNLRVFLEGLDVCGFLLTSGNNIGLLPDEEDLDIDDASVPRDETERALIAFAVEQHLSVLGVCRGMQLLNVHFGGRLVRNLDEVSERRNSHVASNHEIEIVDAEWRRRLRTKAVTTNSFHRQGVTLATLSSQLRPFAVGAKGVVEGLYHPDLPITGIQWHPERSGSASEVDDIVLRSWLTGERIACT